MTEASRRALEGLRDWSTLQWYAVPLFVIVLYVYAVEIKAARRTGSWDAVIAGLTLFGMDFINETWNGWVLALTERSAFWTVPGPTALRTMVGWNLEIMLMFALAGLVYFHTLSDDPEGRPLVRRREAWAWAVAYAVFSVAVEIALNLGGLLIWEYPFWNRSFGGVWLIFLFGYFHFFVAIILVLSLRRPSRRWLAVGSLYAVAVAMNLFGMGIMGWRY